jgi:hypothetical protein
MGIALRLEEFDAPAQELLRSADIAVGADLSQIVPMRNTIQKFPKERKPLITWMLDPSQIDSLCRTVPLDMDVNLLGYNFPVDLVKIITRSCNLATLGCLGLTRRGVLAQSMSLARKIRLFDSIPDAKFVRYALSLFTLPLFGTRGPVISIFFSLGLT